MKIVVTSNDIKLQGVAAGLFSAGRFHEEAEEAGFQGVGGAGRNRTDA